MPDRPEFNADVYNTVANTPDLGGVNRMSESEKAEKLRLSQLLNQIKSNSIASRSSRRSLGDDTSSLVVADQLSHYSGDQSSNLLDQVDDPYDVSIEQMVELLDRLSSAATRYTQGLIDSGQSSAEELLEFHDGIGDGLQDSIIKTLLDLKGLIDSIIAWKGERNFLFAAWVGDRVWDKVTPDWLYTPRGQYIGSELRRLSREDRQRVETAAMVYRTVNEIVGSAIGEQRTDFMALLFQQDEQALRRVNFRTLQFITITAELMADLSEHVAESDAHKRGELLGQAAGVVLIESVTLAATGGYGNAALASSRIVAKVKTSTGAFKAATVKQLGPAIDKFIDGIKKLRRTPDETAKSKLPIVDDTPRYPRLSSGCFVAGTAVHVSSLPTGDAVLKSGAAMSGQRSRLSLHEPSEGSIAVAETDNPRVPIESVPLGARIDSKNPEGPEFTFGHVDPKTWFEVSLRIRRHDGALVEIQILRPDEWIRARNLVVGGSITALLNEIDLKGEGEVLSIEPCGSIADGPGEVVTGRFVTYGVSNLAELTFSDGSTLVGTRSHRIWSATRLDWVALGELESGEEVDSAFGPLQVVSNRDLGHAADVYNIEVNHQHVYRVSERGVLVHNADGDCLVFNSETGKWYDIRTGAELPTKSVPKLHEELWEDLPASHIDADDYVDFQKNTQGWFTKESSLQPPKSHNRDRSQGWRWYQKAKNSSEELVIGSGDEVRRFSRANPAETQRLHARPWQKQVNDAWVLGGVERKATFRVVTNINATRFRRRFDADLGKNVESIFSRELRLLEQHGYQFIQDPNGPVGTGWMVPPGI